MEKNNSKNPKKELEYISKKKEEVIIQDNNELKMIIKHLTQENKILETKINNRLIDDVNIKKKFKQEIKDLTERNEKLHQTQ